MKIKIKNVVGAISFYCSKLKQRLSLPLKKNLKLLSPRNRLQKAIIIGFSSIFLVASLIVGFNSFNDNLDIAKASSLDTSFTNIYQIIPSPDDQFLYVRGASASGPGVSKVDVATNTATGISVNYPSNSGFDMLLNPDGSKLYLVLYDSIKVLNTSDFSLVTSINVDSSPSGARAIFNTSGSKLYVGGSNTVRVIDTASNMVSATITDPKISLSFGENYYSYDTNRYSQKSMVFSPDGSKLYLAGGKYIDTATDTLNAQDLLSGTNTEGNKLLITKDGGKLYASGGIVAQPTSVSNGLGFATKVIDLKTGQLEKLLPYGVTLLSPDGSKLYIISELPNRQSATYYPTRAIIRVYDTITNSLISSNDTLKVSPEYALMSGDGSVIYNSGFIGISFGTVASSELISTDTLTNNDSISDNGATIDTIYDASPRALSNDGKSAYYSSSRTDSFHTSGVARVIKRDTSLLTSSDIASFNCTAPTTTLGSTVTCTVNTATTRYGLAKFDVGLESCTAYFPPTGANTASCTYIANNIQSSTITITPSYGVPSTSANSLAITGGANDTAIDVANITTNNNCTVTGNVKINTFFDCNFNLTGSSSNTYILPTNGIKLGISTVTSKSDNCTILNNGTNTAKLNCKNITSAGGTPGAQNLQAFINNNSTGNNVGTINLTDGFLVNSSTDTIDSTPGDGYCGDSTGQCTLRAAVMEANSDYIKDKITIPAGIYQLTIAPTNYSLGAIDGDLDVTTDIDFVGAGKDTTFVQAGSDNTNGIDRVFHIFNTNVNMSNLTVRYGRILNDSLGDDAAFSSVVYNMPRPGNGGGIYYQRYNDFGLTSENSLIPQTGTLIDQYSGFRKDLNLTDVVISDNYAQNSGGGIYNSALYSAFTNTDIKNNESGKFGGGLSRTLVGDINTTKPTCYDLGNIGYIPTGQLDLINSNLDTNKAITGAGLYHDHAIKITLDSTTKITNNTASENGGGIFNAECTFTPSGGLTITINGAQISGNTAVNGGGIFNESGHVETFAGTKIFNNTATGRGSAWFGGAIVESGFNAVRSRSLNDATDTLIYNNIGTSTISMIVRSSATIKNTMIDHNDGMGVELDKGAGASIDSSTIYYNSSRGVYYTGVGTGSADATLNIVNSTISGNASSGIKFNGSSIAFTGNHLTIFDNGYGIAIPSTTEVPTSFGLSNSIVASNTFGNCVGLNDVLPTFSFGGVYNGFTDNADCSATSGFTVDAEVKNMMGVIQNNGGPTLTHALLTGNPAIDGAGSGTNIDQRGLPRPNACGGFDAGAFELQQTICLNAVDDNQTMALSAIDITIDVLANDNGGINGIDTGSVTVVDQPTKGALTDNGNGNFTYTPDSGQFSSTGTDTFTYYFLDNSGTQSNTATVTITVSVNNPPIASDDYVSGNEVDAAVIYILANDTDSDGTIDPTTVFIQDQPQKGNLSINNTNGEATYTPNSALYPSTGTDSFTYKVKDNSGEYSNLASVNINITPKSIITSASCDPKFAYLTITSTCIANFTQNRTGTITFANSVSNCTTGNIGLTDTSASCSFTIPTPSTNPYDVNLTTTEGETLNSVDSIFVSPLPSLVSMTPNFGPTTGGTTSVADLSLIPGNDRNFGVATDSSGNVYVSGQVFGSVKAGNNYLNGYGGEDIFVAKYDPNGNIIWAQLAGGTGNDRARGLILDNSNNVFITGYFKSEAKFGSETMLSTGDSDIFISKLDSNGNWEWTKTAGSVAFDEGAGIGKDNNDNVYITGTFNANGGFSTNAKFGPNTLQARGLTDMFVSKLDTNGNWLWTTRAGAESFDFAQAISVNGSSIFISGHYNNYTTFGNINLILDMGRSGYDSFLAKLDLDGNFLWAKDIGNTGVDTFNGDQGYSGNVYSDSDGNSYVMGIFYKDYIDFAGAGAVYNRSTRTVSQRAADASAGGGSAQHYIAKANSNGDWVWATQLGESFYGFSSSFVQVNNNTGYVVTTIADSSSINVQGQIINKTNTFYNSILAQISLNDGSLSNITPSSGTGGSEIIRAITIDVNNNLILVGNSSGVTKFANASYQSTGGFDSTIFRYNTQTNNFDSVQGLGGYTAFFVDLNSAQNSLKFDNINATINSINSPINATVTSPAHPAGFVDVQATNSLNLSSTLNNGFEYIPQPQASPDTATTPESTPITIDVLANDTNVTNICTGSISGVSNGTATITTVGNLDKTLFTPTLGYYGTITFTYTACSTVVGTNPSQPATVTVNVTQVNPIAVNDTATVNQNENVTIDVLANDNDPSGQTLTICSPLSTASNGTITKTTLSGTEKIVFTPTLGFSGSTTFTYTACDPAANSSNIATVIVTVVPNTPPVANNDTATTPESTPITIDVLANDTNAANICSGSITLASGSTTNATAVLSTVGNVDKVLVTPVIGYYGTITFTYTACSTVVGTNPSQPATVTVNVTQVNPIAVNDTATVNQNENVTIDVLANDNDPSGQTLTICSPLSTASNGTIVKQNVTVGSTTTEQIKFTPTPGFSGSTTFTYTACDPAANSSNIATVIVTVVPNTPPVANNDTATTLVSAPITINLPANDTDSDGTLDLTSVIVVTNPTKGTVIINSTTGVATYTPTSSSFPTPSTDTFTYKIKDNDATFSNVASVTVNVTLPPTVIQNIQLMLYKEKPDSSIVVNEPLKIQADIKNPNNFVVEKTETIINIDTTKLNFVSGSAKQGTISGTKYSAIEKILKNLAGSNIEVEAATSVTFSALSDSQLKVTALNLQPNEVINVVFDVIPKADIQNSVSGNTSIIDITTNQPLATANAQVTITPTAPVFTIIRTGGLVLPVGVLCLFALAIASWMAWKRRKIIKS